MLEHEDVEPLKNITPLEQIGFSKDNLCHCFAQRRGWRVVVEDIGVSSAQRGGRGFATGGRPS